MQDADTGVASAGVGAAPTTPMDADISCDHSTADALRCDVIIIGGGVAGLSVALTLPADVAVIVVTKGALGESNTRYAQGGLAAPVGLDDDPELHLRDTIAAGAGLVDEPATRALVSEAREAVAWLVGVGAEFDQREGASRVTTADADPLKALATRFTLGREAAHSRRRILHAHGDATGAEIERALVAALRRRPGARVFEHTLALELMLRDGVCVGVEARGPGAADAPTVRMLARLGVALANGGAGQLWLRSSNPAGATADGLALAARAGAALADVEFMQFHPTVLVPPTPDAEPFLVTEAVRGEGAYLRNAAGERFMLGYHPDAELAPRDVVARAILSEMLREGGSSVSLDLRHLPAAEVYSRFPTVAAACRSFGLDLARDLIPVAPAAHYFMGGVAVDTDARTTLPNLYAVGEVACTGVHGANRLASNSLLEGLVFGRRAARAIAAAALAPASVASWPQQPALPGAWLAVTGIAPVAVTRAAPPADGVRATLRRIMWERVSLRRDAAGLTAALEALEALCAAGPVDPETANMLFAAQVITRAALARTESRGGHYREDFPERDRVADGRHTLLRVPAVSGAPLVDAGVAREELAHV